MDTTLNDGFGSISTIMQIWQFVILLLTLVITVIIVRLYLRLMKFLKLRIKKLELKSNN